MALATLTNIMTILYKALKGQRKQICNK